jgi:hypothetical protein
MSDLELAPASLFVPRVAVIITWLVAQGMAVASLLINPLVSALATTCFFAASLLAAELVFGELVVIPKPSTPLNPSRSAHLARRTWFGLRRRSSPPLKVRAVGSEDTAGTAQREL